MDCDILALTGLPPLAAPLILALACLIIGLILVLARRRTRPARAAAGLLLLLALIFPATTLPQPAQAATTTCLPGPNNEVTAAQTTSIIGVAPGTTPQPVTGTVTNTGRKARFITAVTVSITSVVKAAGAADGSCDASDYILTNTAMPVEQVLRPAQTTTFHGALLGFSNKSVNQDACKKAIVHLTFNVS